MQNVRIDEHYLQPGGVLFGDRSTRIHTLLGSCVAIVFWHPKLVIGGMCHFMLPQRRGERDGKLDGRYGDEALVLMLYQVARLHAHVDDFRVSVYGGGNMFPNITPATRSHVGKQNAQAARALLDANGIRCNSYHVEGIGHRKLTFDISSGHVQHRHSHTTCDQGLQIGKAAELKVR